MVECFQVARDGDATIFRERPRGRTLRDLAQANGLSVEGIRQVVLRESEAMVNEFEVSLYLAAKLEWLGREDEAGWPTLLVPFQEQDGWQVSLALLQFVVDRLRARDVNVHVRSRPTPNGTAFMLTLGEKPP